MRCCFFLDLGDNFALSLLINSYTRLCPFLFVYYISPSFINATQNKHQVMQHYSITIFSNIFLKIILVFKDFIYFIFRQRGRQGKRVGEKHQCAVASCTPSSGDRVHNPGMCSDWESNQRPCGSQAGTQSLNPLSHTTQGYIL